MKYSALLILFLVTSCTDVPLSNNTRILNRRILGCWQANDSLAISFTEKDEKALYRQYEFKEGQFVVPEEPLPVYFSDMVIAGSKHQFVSMGDKGQFINFEYSINATGELEIKVFKADLKYAKSKRTAESTYFRTSRNFRRYIKQKIGIADFYGNSILFKQREAIRE